MRILLTGGSGFIGAALLRAARAAGHTVAMLSRPGPAEQRALRLALTDPNVHVLCGSMVSPPWSDIVRFQPEACVHAAWITTPGVYLESRDNHFWVRSSLDLFAGLRNLGVRHAVALGTCLEYQLSGSAAEEDVTPVAPISTYARCKDRLHTELRATLSVAGISLAWARIFYPYGEGEHPERLMSSLVRKLNLGEPISLKTPTSVKDYIHVEDVASALLTLVECSYNGTINVGTGEGVSVGFIAQRLAELADRTQAVDPSAPACEPGWGDSFNVSPVTGVVSLDPLAFVVANTSRLRRLGWRPQISLEAGLRRMVAAGPR